MIPSSTCLHMRLWTDNVVTGCEDCGLDWTAITLAHWPKRLRCARLGEAWGPRCKCGKKFLTQHYFRFCPSCDVEPTWWQKRVMRWKRRRDQLLDDIKHLCGL